MTQGARQIAIGLLLGLACAFTAGRTLESMLYQASARDPLTVFAITFVLIAVAALACWLPARRATKVDPISALRAE
jgi:ABC-type antimicrobial peptide transport system permease subunit